MDSGYSRNEIKQELRRLEHERRSVAGSPLKKFSKKIVTKTVHSFAGMLPF